MHLESQLYDYFSSKASNLEFSGSVFIASKGRIIINAGYGLANREHDVPNTPITKFRIGSITKQFTAMCVLMLEQQGKLSLEDPLSTYVPSFPHASQITLHHLLTHTSGVPNITQISNFQEIMKHPASPEKIIEMLKDLPLDFMPGSQFLYNNSGYIMLAHLIQEISEQTYGEFLRKSIFAPLGMEDTGCDSQHEIILHRASGYEYREGLINAEYIDMTLPTGGGNLYSTSEDLYKWDQALYEESLVPQNVITRMFTPYCSNYGYGWFIDTESESSRRVYHGGGIAGFKSEISRFIDDKLTMIFLNNLATTDVGQISSDVGRFLTNGEFIRAIVNEE